MTSKTFNDKVAMVTGAGSGIGRALALGLAARGARLALADIDATALAESAEQVGRQGADVHQQQLDVSDRDGFERYASVVADHFGVVHQVFNNAGIGRSRPVVDMTYHDYERVFSINLWGVINGTKAFLPHLIASGDGYVVNVSSLNGFMAYPGLSAYCASKFAVRGFTEALRIEMLQARHPVGVTVVHPGGVQTNIAKHGRALAQADGIPNTPETERRAADDERRFLRLSPDAAARTILDGVAAGKSRVMVGNDARVIDKLVRLLPAVYPRAVARLTATVGGS